jgi:ribose transport system substrate-binding protein
MTDRVDAPRANVHLSFIVTLVALIVVGAILYFTLASPNSTKRVNLAEQFNADVSVIKSKADLESQNKDIRDLLSQGVEGIGLSPNDPTQQAGLLSEAARKCPVVMFDVDAPESQRRVFVGIDNYAAGHYAADEMREALPDGGAVIITVGSVDMPHGRERRQGVIDGLLDRHYSLDHAIDPLDVQLKAGNYSVVATIIDRGDPDQSAALLAEALKTYPHTKGVVALFSYSAAAALKAIDQAGKAGQIKVVCFDDTQEVQTGIRDGRIAASILQDTYRMGNETIRLLAEEVRNPERIGPTNQRRVLVQVDVIRQDNIDQMRKDGRIRAVDVPAATPPVK